MSIGEFCHKLKLIVATQWRVRFYSCRRHFYACFVPWVVWLILHTMHSHHLPLPRDRFELRDSYLNITALRPMKFEGEHAVYYAPKNDFTDRLMQTFRNDCFPLTPRNDRDAWDNYYGTRFSIRIEGFPNEKELLKAYRAIEVKESDSRYSKPRTNYAGVIFAANFSEASKTLHYKIQSRYLNYDRLFYEQIEWWEPVGDEYLIETNRILATQACLDASFIKLKTENNPARPKYDIALKRLNLPNERDFSKVDYVYTSYVTKLPIATALILASLLVPIAFEVYYVILDHKHGIDILLDSNGVSRAMYYFIAYIHSIVYLSFIIMIGALLTCNMFDYTGSFFVQSDTSLLIVLLTLFAAHYTVLLINIFLIMRNTLLIISTWLAYFVGTLLLSAMPIQNICFETLVLLGIYFPSAWYFKILRVAEYLEMNREGLLWRDVLNNSFLQNPQLAMGFAMLLSIFVVSYFVIATLLWAKPSITRQLKVKIKSDSSLIYPNVEETSPKSNPVIELKNVNVFNNDASLRNVSIEFYEGEITSVIECNGQSNHTLLRALSEPKLSKMAINMPKRKVGIFTGTDCFISNLTAHENLRFMAQLRNEGKSSYEVEQDIDDIAQTFKLPHAFDWVKAKNLKKGQQRRLSLAMTMVGDTNVVLLSNPTKGLDKDDICIIWDALQKLRNYKKAIIVSTGSMSEAEVISDRIAVLTTGKLECYGTPKYLKERYAPEACFGYAARKWKDSDETDEGSDELRNLNKQPKKVLGEPTLADLFSDVHEAIEVQELASPFVNYNKLLDADDPMKKLKKLRDTRRYVLNRYLRRRKSIFLMSTIFGLLLLGVAEHISILNMPIINVPETIKITPNMYQNAETYVSAFNESIENNYGSFNHWKSVKLAGANLTNALYQRAKDQLATFGSRLVAAAEFSETANGTIVGSAIFTSKAVYSLPISLNLANNALLKYMTDFEHDIRVHLQRIPSMDSLFTLRDYNQWVAVSWALSFLTWLVLLVRNFLYLPLEENVKKMKHLQIMAGMPKIVYWGYWPFYDLVLGLACIAVVLSTIFYLDVYKGAHFHTPESMTLISMSCVYFLMSGLGISYIFSCIRMSKTFVARMMIGVIIVTSMADFILIAVVDRHAVNWLNLVAYFSPYHALFMSIVSICQTNLTNNKCKFTPNEYQDPKCTEYRYDACCRMHCYDGVCKYPMRYMEFYGRDIPLVVPFVYSIILPFFIFFILYVAESPRKYYHQFLSHLRSKTILRNFENPSESMVKEKQIISQKVAELKGETYTFANQYLQNENQPPKRTGNVPCLDDEVIVVHELCKRSFTKQLVYDVSFRVHEGECLGIVSPYKAGKSTLLEMIVGVQTPDDGSIFIKGKNFRFKQDEILEKMAYCPQENFLYDELTIAEHFHIFSRLRNLPEKLGVAETDYWSDVFQIKKYLKFKGNVLTTNVRKRTMMALTVMGGPELLILDQPTAGCNAYSKRIIWTVIKSLKAARCTILIATDNFDEADILCDRVSMIVKGQLMNNLVPKSHEE
ncbi:ATP-binding cassette sub-family A member 5-like [Trichogramma pretiosum]|uniref:ATP-binding cassette sub-family A member 5-like n=1 Tax=Trichogramma pretiosum TaxID=7493 RepID=UPI000C7195AC|nr:ATP-binding cassette sub-family A member 5-like [Trichogramma pretiosum]